MSGWNGQRWFVSNWYASEWFGPSDAAGNLSGAVSFGITASGDLTDDSAFVPSPVFWGFTRVELAPIKKKVYLQARLKSVSQVSAKLNQVAMLCVVCTAASEVKASCKTVFNIQRTRRIASAILFDLAA